MKKYLSFILFLSISSAFLQAKEPVKNGKGYSCPLACPPLLNGGFGELRANHFHAGLDYKTESIENKPVMSVADGYVSRVSISPSGYGKLLFIAHPHTGETSVYAHLNGFAPKIDSLVRNYQYKNQTFSCDIRFSADSITVKQGEFVALSGNTGGSAGPHLHFELRDTETEDFINPAVYKMGITDNVPPKFFTLKIYPQRNEGILNGSQTTKKIPLTTNAQGISRFTNPTELTAWGKIGLGIKAYDYANGTANTLGINTVSLEVDGKEIFRYRNDRFKTADNRYINSFIDYDEYKRSGEFIMKSFVDKGNLAGFFENVANQGILNICEERVYPVRYIISDAYGNKSMFSFNIKGRKTAIAPSAEKCGIRMPFDVDNRFETEQVRVEIPKNTLYNDICFEFATEKSEKFYSDYYQIHVDNVPLHQFFNIAIKLNDKQIRDTAKLYALRSDAKNRTQPYVGKVENGFYTFKARDFGKFVIKTDTVAPKITPLNFSNFAAAPFISLKITDNITGIASYNGYIDGKWVLFEYDLKTSTIKYLLRKEEIGRNKNHKFRLVVRDLVGNETAFEKMFWW
ncbi:peptidase M23 [Bacteroidia bacterium]|nr:peptidase M23 [Bacteroidia bacterium]